MKKQNDKANAESIIIEKKKKFRFWVLVEVTVWYFPVLTFGHMPMAVNCHVQRYQSVRTIISAYMHFLT